jgi:hypothetical protein
MMEYDIKAFKQKNRSIQSVTPYCSRTHTETQLLLKWLRFFKVLHTYKRNIVARVVASGALPQELVLFQIFSLATWQLSVVGFIQLKKATTTASVEF